jgi:predicted  nucleic acid-binding Zn-ribbon protein
LTPAGEQFSRLEPLEREAGEIRKRLAGIEGEIGRYVKALGQGKLSIERLEAEIVGLETDKSALQLQLDDLQRRINESAARDYNAELLQRTLRDFRSAFAVLTAPEQSEALQCVVKSVTVHPQKLDLEIFELQEFLPGSQNRKEWLPGLDSN